VLAKALTRIDHKVTIYTDPDPLPPITMQARRRCRRGAADEEHRRTHAGGSEGQDVFQYPVSEVRMRSQRSLTRTSENKGVLAS
jgi:hypothetical protein